MKQKYIYFSILLTFVISLSLITASSEYVVFDGNWENGTTLFSKIYDSGNYTLFSKSVYPIRPISRECTTTTICSSYNYHYEKECLKYSGSRCILTTTHRVIDSCKTYRNITKCISPKVGCVNPETGVYTNQLSLYAYKYSTDGVNWVQVPFNILKLDDTQVQFKLDIPNECSPEYYKDKAILITTR